MTKLSALFPQGKGKPMSKYDEVNGGFKITQTKERDAVFDAILQKTAMELERPDGVYASEFQRHTEESREWFDICPVNEASKILNVPYRSNDAYRFLQAFHCVGWFKIPRAIRKRIPELIREALREQAADRKP